MSSIALPRMTRVTWYRHRAALLGIIAAFSAAIAFLLIDGFLLRSWLSSHHVPPAAW